MESLEAASKKAEEEDAKFARAQEELTNVIREAGEANKVFTKAFVESSIAEVQQEYPERYSRMSQIAAAAVG